MQVALTEETVVELYDSHTVAAQLEIPYRTLMYWVETGLVRPHTYTGRRRTPVLFSDKDVKEVGRLAQLRRYLFSTRDSEPKPRREDTAEQG
jgi:DNA-binding transcriptional MerR regulator